MKILVFSSYKSAWNSVRPEAEIFIEIAKLGHSVCIATQADSEYVNRFMEHNIRIIDCYPEHKICFKTIRQLRRELTQGDYDICYATNSRTIPNAAFACMGKPVKLVGYRGTTKGLYRHDPSSYLTLLHPRIDAVSCQAEAVRKHVLKKVWKGKKNVVTIHKGQEPGWFNNEKADLSEFGIDSDAFVVTCVANARPSKGIGVLIESTKYLAQADNLHLLLVGRDIDREPYLSAVKTSPMSQRIHITGYRSNAPAFIASSTVCVQPSIRGEGLSKTVPEAMAQSVPSIVTTAGGLSELIDEAKTGFVVPAGDPQAIAQKILKLYHNKALAPKMGKAALLHLKKNFSLKNNVQGHLDLFNSLLSGEKGPEYGCEDCRFFCSAADG